ncbi:cytochromesubunit B of the bc complex-like protein [Rubrobacter indicoceani]|uniref:cytochromesubunit B of the bc complex-like protein n=1 Tax=Rubrobacter indicoceani TaxID=2051957 RepID=UPI000E5BB63E|nr:cytochromesubunit B of the bc complex-like protein [Rubrobacter indicoceani]
MTDIKYGQTETRDNVAQGRAAPAKPKDAEVITEENVFDRPDETMGFFPGQIVRDAVVSCLLLIACAVLSYAAPAPLAGPADPATVDYVPRPEWFFFFYEQMLMFFPGYALIAFGAVVIPGVFVVLLFALPWLDRTPVHSPVRRPFMTIIGVLVIVIVLLNMLLAVSRIINFPGQ